MSVQLEFSRRAGSYDQFNMVQKRVAQTLAGMIRDRKPGRICDLGCGSGTLFEQIDWPVEKMVAVDFSRAMCDLHPEGAGVRILCLDFNHPACFETLAKEGPFDMILSSSALQWAEDLDATLDGIRSLQTPVALALFTGNTFSTLLETAGLVSPIRKPEELDRLALKHFGKRWAYRQYTLKFENRLEMFRYIKKSGVSGGERRLAYTQAKKLLRAYPLDYLEFEVGYLVASP